jgi:hypothetical protein
VSYLLFVFDALIAHGNTRHQFSSLKIMTETAGFCFPKQTILRRGGGSNNLMVWGRPESGVGHLNGFALWLGN